MVATELKSVKVAVESDLLDSIVDQTIDTKLDACERNDFDMLDSNIRRIFREFKSLGLSLKEVRDRRLYREQYKTFELYVAEVGLTRQRAYELIDAAAVAKSVSEISDIPITRESHAAALAEVPAEGRPAVLKIAAESTGGKITAKSIKAAAAEVRADDKDDDAGDGREEWLNNHVRDFTEEPLLTTKKAVIKLTDKEVRNLKTNTNKLCFEINQSVNRVDRIVMLLGGNEDALIQVRGLLVEAMNIASENQRSWAGRKNKMEVRA